jgi:hypothetical protein
MQACGDTENPVAPPGVDSGPEVAPPPPDAATCDLSANLLDKIPDAAIADGASTSGVCIRCANAKCATQVSACNANCQCQSVVARGLDCYLKNTTDPTACLAQFATVDVKIQSIGLVLVTCLNSACEQECATASFQEADGGDGG